MKKQSVYKKALLLAVPMMIQNGITNAVSLVDNLMVGSLGTESMTAVSIVGQLIFVFFLAVFGGLSGPGIYGAQYYGQRNKEGYQNVFRLKVWITAVITFCGLLAFFTMGSQMISLYLHSTAKDIDAAKTLQYGMQYLDIMMIGLIPFAITQIYAGSLREMGESIKPMIGGIASVAVDIVFNYLLIYGKCGFPRLEVRGAAIATVMARFVEMFIVVIWTHASVNKYEFLRGIYKTICIPLHSMKNIIIKGLPIFFNEFLWSGGIAVLTQCYSMKGLQIVAGLNISNAICQNFIDSVNYQINQVREISIKEVDWLGVIPIEDRLEEMKFFYEDLIDRSNITNDISKEELLPYLELQILNCICDVVMMTKQPKSVKLRMMNDAVRLSGIHTGVTPEQYVREIANNTEMGKFYKTMFSSGNPLGSFWLVIFTMGGQLYGTDATDEPIGIVNNIFSILIQIENYLDEKYNFLGKDSIAKEYMLHIIEQLADKCDEED